jgi:hypothetical protein
MKTIICVLILGATCAIGACGRSTSDAPAVTRQATDPIEESLQEISRETGLTIIDLSVPFERFADAPARLRRLAGALANGSPGLYVLRYYDDTLRHTQHVFAVHQQSTTYIKLSSILNERPTREELSVSSADYDDPTKTLILHTQAGNIRLTPTDITPAGA